MKAVVVAAPDAFGRSLAVARLREAPSGLPRLPKGSQPSLPVGQTHSPLHGPSIRQSPAALGCQQAGTTGGQGASHRRARGVQGGHSRSRTPARQRSKASGVRPRRSCRRGRPPDPGVFEGRGKRPLKPVDGAGVSQNEPTRKVRTRASDQYGDRATAAQPRGTQNEGGRGEGTDQEGPTPLSTPGAPTGGGRRIGAGPARPAPRRSGPGRSAAGARRRWRTAGSRRPAAGWAR